MSFRTWFTLVDKQVQFIAFGCSAHDLPDMPYRTWFEGGMRPDAAAELALELSGFAFERLEYLDEDPGAWDEALSGVV